MVHGDEGIAAPWAAHAAGDVLTMSGSKRAYRPDPGSDWHLLAGDESALPAICSALEALPVDARGIAYLETSDRASTSIPEGARRPRGRLAAPLQPGGQPRLLADALLAGPWLPAGPTCSPTGSGSR